MLYIGTPEQFAADEAVLAARIAAKKPPVVGVCTDCDYCGEIRICYPHEGGKGCRSCIAEIEKEEAGTPSLGDRFPNNNY